MELIVDKKTKSGRLILKDDLTIGRIQQIHDELEGALGKVKNLIIDVQFATDVDLTFLQLLCSAHRTAIGKNKALSLSGQINPAMEKAISENYYSREKGCILDKPNTCLWMVKEDE